MKKFEIIAFDADDTLWINEPLFQRAEKKFCKLLSYYLPESVISEELLKVEISNISMYGYGVKSFVLSMIETAIKISGNSIDAHQIEKIINLGKQLINEPVELIDGVKEVLQNLQKRYRLVLATKGDLLDQERKLEKSGLAYYFHHIEVMSEKNEPEYSRVLDQLNVKAHNFLMIGNSMKSDIIPVLNIGGHGFHVPYHTTWELEKTNEEIFSSNFRRFNRISDVLSHLN